MNHHENCSENPFQAPTTRNDDWTFDRSGVARRVAEIFVVSASGAIGGGIIGMKMLPNFRVGGNGGNWMVIVGAISCLMIWAATKVRKMWKRSPSIGLDSHEPN